MSETTGKGYISLQVHPEDARVLNQWAQSLNILNLHPAEKLHTTIMYDESNPTIDTPDPQKVYRAEITTPEVLGEGEWQGLVLNLHSAEVQQRFTQLQTMGYRHSYPDLKLHISLKYRPSAQDIDMLKQHMDSCPLYSVRLLNEKVTRCN